MLISAIYAGEQRTALHVQHSSVAPLTIAATCMKSGCDKATANKASFGRTDSD